MWSFPACPGSGMGRVRLDVIRFPVLPYPAASQACVWGTRDACEAPSQKAGQQPSRANRLRRQNERAALHFRVNAKIPYPLLHSSLSSETTSLGLVGDAGVRYAPAQGFPLWWKLSA